MNVHIHTYMQNIHTQVDTYTQKHDHAFTHIYVLANTYMHIQTYTQHRDTNAHI